MPESSSREQRWAEHENQHRQQSYRAALNAWQLDHDQLTRMLRMARSPEGAAPSAGNPVVLKRKETVYAELPSASLVEVQRGAGHYTGGYSGFSFRLMKGVRYNIGGSRGSYVQGAEQLRITDEGRVTVTNQRVVFTGERNSREWAYAKLVSVQHDSERPLTMIGVANRQKLSGLGYPLGTTSDFRFKLSLAVAQYQETLPALVAALEAELAEHNKARPVEPPVATAGQAPHGAEALLGLVSLVFTGKKTWKPIWRAAQALGIALVMITLISTAASGGSKHGSATRHASLVPAVTLPAPVETATATTAPTQAGVPPPVALPKAAAPVTTHPPVVHRHVAPKVAPTHKPTATATHSSKPAPTVAPSHACTLTNSGTCIQNGQFCRTADEGTYGYDGSGRRLYCNPGNRHWQAA
jgi:hypothetical protein